MKISKFLELVLKISVLCYVNCDMFTSQHRMDGALRESLPALINDMDTYVEEETQRLDRLSCLKTEMLTLQKDLIEVLDQTPGDPMSFYKFADYFATNWKRVEESLDTTRADELRNQIMDTREELPIDADKIGLMDGVYRTQIVFGLNSTELAMGRIMHKKSAKLSAMDCFQFSKYMMKKNNFRLALEWITAAEIVYDESSEPKGVVQDYEGKNKQFGIELIQALKQNAEKKLAERWQSLRNDVHTGLFAAKANAKQNVFQSRKELNRAVEVLEKYKKNQIKYIGSEINRNTDEVQQYEKLCNDIVPLPEEEIRKVQRCFYAKLDNGFYKLRKVKVEVMRLDPIILMLHDLTYDKDIEYMKRTVLNDVGMKRSVVRKRDKNPSSNQPKASDSRISESAYLPEMDPVSLKIDAMFESILNLDFSIDLTEPYKISNYGPAGVFELHVDFWQSKKVRMLEFGLLLFSNFDIAIGVYVKQIGMCHKNDRAIYFLWTEE